MKKYVLLFVIAIGMIIPAKAQPDYKRVYESKIRTFSHMRNAGWIMTGIGGGATAAGALLLITIPDSFWDDNYDSSYDDQGQAEIQMLGGIVCLTVGIALLAGGITMGSIGSHKVRAYKQKLNNLSVGVICDPNRQGLTLTYRF
jgi:hypothetical protein